MPMSEELKATLERIRILIHERMPTIQFDESEYEKPLKMKVTKTTKDKIGEIFYRELENGKTRSHAVHVAARELGIGASEAGRILRTKNR